MQFIFVMVKCCCFFEVRTEYLKHYLDELRFQRVKIIELDCIKDDRSGEYSIYEKNRLQVAKKGFEFQHKSGCHTAMVTCIITQLLHYISMDKLNTVLNTSRKRQSCYAVHVSFDSTVLN
jgi:hypothetical protein